MGLLKLMLNLFGMINIQVKGPYFDDLKGNLNGFCSDTFEPGSFFSDSV